MKKYSIGVDLGGTVIKLGLVTDEGLAEVLTFAADSACGMEPKLRQIASAIEELRSRHGLAEARFEGVGIAFPGLADPVRGKVLSTNAKYDDAPRLDLGGWADSLGARRFYIDNDARMAAVGEWKYGAGRGTDNMVMFTIGTGIGSGVIIEGTVLRGAHYQAGCLGGHLSVDFRGRKCTCGNTGCVEAMASSFFLDEIIRADKSVAPGFYESGRPFDFRKIFDMTRSGDADAGAIARRCMDVWAAGIVNLIHAYDPEKVVLAGGVTGSSDIVLPYLREKVSRLAWTPWGEVEIVVSQLGHDAAILGVTDYIMK